MANNLLSDLKADRIHRIDVNFQITSKLIFYI